MLKFFPVFQTLKNIFLSDYNIALERMLKSAKFSIEVINCALKMVKKIPFKKSYVCFLYRKDFLPEVRQSHSFENRVKSLKREVTPELFEPSKP